MKKRVGRFLVYECPSPETGTAYYIYEASRPTGEGSELACCTKLGAALDLADKMESGTVHIPAAHLQARLKKAQHTSDTFNTSAAGTDGYYQLPFKKQSKSDT